MSEQAASVEDAGQDSMKDALVVIKGADPAVVVNQVPDKVEVRLLNGKTKKVKAKDVMIPPAFYDSATIGTNVSRYPVADPSLLVRLKGRGVASRPRSLLGARRAEGGTTSHWGKVG